MQSEPGAWFPTKNLSAYAAPNPLREQNQQKKASETQIGGDHYTKILIQPWDYTIANNLDYFQGTIVKYVTRWRDKGGVEDLRKAMHFLQKYIETHEPPTPNN